MSFKSYLFIVLCMTIVSCGSTKQVVNPKPDSTTQTEEQSTSIDVQLKHEVVTDHKKEIEDKTNISTDIESTISHEEEHTPIVETNIEVSDERINHDAWNCLLQKHVSKDGNVNYKGFKSDRVKFYSYIEYLQKNVPNDTWKRNEKLSYWINAYNAFTVDLILRNYPLQSIKDIKDPWDQRLWKIGEKWYNLNEIEHQILRKMNEPRIHFAIVCASVSCPKLKNTVFLASNMDEQLTIATKEFLSDPSKNKIAKNNLELSKIFKWFSKDFKSKDSDLIEFINQYSEIEVSKSAKKSYLDYNWNLNE